MLIEIIPYNTESIPEDIIRSLRLLFLTRVGEQALDRNFGMSQDWLDLPLPEAKARLINEMIIKAKRYEPRAHIKAINVDYQAMDGVVHVKVVVQSV